MSRLLAVMFSLLPDLLYPSYEAFPIIPVRKGFDKDDLLERIYFEWLQRAASRRLPC